MAWWDDAWQATTNVASAVGGGIVNAASAVGGGIVNAAVATGNFIGGVGNAVIGNPIVKAVSNVVGTVGEKVVRTSLNGLGMGVIPLGDIAMDTVHVAADTIGGMLGGGGSPAVAPSSPVGAGVQPLPMTQAIFVSGGGSVSMGSDGLAAWTKINRRANGTL